MKYRTLSQKYLVDPIIGSLGKAWDQDQYTPQVDDAEESFDPIVVSEETIQSMMITVHALLASAEPSPEIIHAFLSTSITALYHLYQFSCQSKSSFKETTVDILTTYFRIVSTSDATTELKRILFDKNSDKRLAYFAPGPTGGVVMRLHKFVFSPKEITYSNVNKFLLTLGYTTLGYTGNYRLWREITCMWTQISLLTLSKPLGYRTCAGTSLLLY